MKLFCIRTGELAVNTYFLVNERTKGAIVIDAGEDFELIKSRAKEKGITIKAELLTHGHFDHAGSAKKLQDSGVKIFISQIDAIKLLNDDNLSKDFGKEFDRCSADYRFKDGDTLVIEGITVKAVLTPGHTDGSATFIIDDMMFTGDTLFFESVGRTDFPTGNGKELVKSVKKLFAFDGDYKVYTGHGEFTTLDHERKYNRYI